MEKHTKPLTFNILEANYLLAALRLQIDFEEHTSDIRADIYRKLYRKIEDATPKEWWE